MDADVTDEDALSVLDLGTGFVKALVVEPGPGRVTILASAAEPAPPAEPAGARDLDALVAACERALVAAEDAAGVVPTRAVFGLTAQRAATGCGDVEGRRSSAHAPLTPEELRPLAERAKRAALAGARRRDAAEFATATALHPLDATITAVEVDSQTVAGFAWGESFPSPQGAREARGEGDLAGGKGALVRLSLATALVPAESVDVVERLAERLDLETAGVLLSPFALGGALAQAGHGPALVVDVGDGLTHVALISARWIEALVTLPLGGGDLAARVAVELGLTLAAAHETVVAHEAGAGAKVAGGTAAAQAVRRLAQHYAEVWLDALGVACAELGRTRPLPPALLLCGGAAGLPELRAALQESSWHLDLPFDAAPALRWLTPRDLPAAVDRGGRLRALQAVPALALAAVAAGTYTPLAAFGELLPRRLI